MNWKLEFKKYGFTYHPISGGADNVAITAGSGTSIAADEVSDGTLGTVKVQFVKLMDGTLDGTTKAAVGANGLNVAAVPMASATATGLTTNRQTALSNTAVAVKASSGRVYGYHIYNPNTSDSYVQLYDVAQGGVSVGTTTPTRTLWIPSGGAIDSQFAIPLSYGTAITIAATTTITGGSAPSSGLLVEIDYI